jgi:hypothetical protein
MHDDARCHNNAKKKEQISNSNIGDFPGRYTCSLHDDQRWTLQTGSAMLSSLITTTPLVDKL